MKYRRAALCALAAVALPAGAVYLNPDGLGQALIYPYYTVQSANGNSFNTYISIANHNADSKVVKLRFREGRNSRPVLEFDVYLAPNDMWTGALVPANSAASAPAHLVTADLGCTNPPLPAAGMDFSNFSYSGPANDGGGTGLDRTREGFFEAIEMATLTGSSASAIAHNASGTPANCSPVQGANVSLGLAPPGGGLSGTVTLINVANGNNFDIGAEALAELSTRSMYRQISDPSPVDFNVPEIDPISHVTANGFQYRSIWNRAVDAVSAVFMRSAWSAEYVLDPGTHSQTDVVAVFPTKQNYVTTQSASPPFSVDFNWTQECASPGTSGSAGEPVTASIFNRESRGGPIFPVDCGFTCPAGVVVPTMCGAAPVTSITSSITAASTVLGALNRGLGGGSFGSVLTGNNGWIEFQPSSGYQISSTGGSTRMNLATGEVTVGPHTYRGLPVTGFWVRTFENGNLSCGAVTCQGNYGGAFPLLYKRSISP